MYKYFDFHFEPDGHFCVCNFIQVHVTQRNSAKTNCNVDPLFFIIILFFTRFNLVIFLLLNVRYMTIYLVVDMRIQHN